MAVNQQVAIGVYPRLGCLKLLLAAVAASVVAARPMWRLCRGGTRKALEQVSELHTWWHGFHREGMKICET